MIVILFWIFTQALGAAGAVLIVYSVGASFTTPWPPIEAIAQFSSALLAIFGTMATAAVSVQNPILLGIRAYT